MPSPCHICGQFHAAEAPCPTVIRQPSSGTAVMGSNAAGIPMIAPVAASPVPSLPQSVLASPAPGTPGMPELAEPDPLIGTTIGSFRIIRMVGKGGMGTVYLGEQTVIGSKVAIKILHPHLATNAALVSRFYAEARAVNLIGHENIVNIFDMNVVPPNRYYLIMEFLEGRTLNQVIRGPMSVELAVPMLLQICDALQAAHAHGVVHRDLKPENIFLIRRGRNDNFIKILDFGIAKLFATEAKSETTSLGTIVGTPEYMAPEQTTGEKVDGRSDIYSLGVIAYLMATGRLPFIGGGLTGLLIAHQQKIPEAPHVVCPQVPREWSDVIMRALSKKPADRYENADAFGSALADVLGALPHQMPGNGRPVSSPQPGAPYLVMPPQPTPPVPTPRIPTPPWERAAPTPRPQDPAEAVARFQRQEDVTESLVDARLEALVAPVARPLRSTPAPAPQVMVAANPGGTPPLGTAVPAPRSVEKPPEPAVAPTPQPVHARHTARFDAVVSGLGTLPCQDISKGGMFLCTEKPLPPVFSRLKIRLPVAGDFECLAEVVRHVTQDQAHAWNMSPGFGVQFLELNLAQKDAISRMVQGLPAQKAAALIHSEDDDRVAANVLDKYSKRINGDHYVVLSVSPDAEFSEIKAHAREMKRELDELKTRPISRRQSEQIDTALQRVQQAVETVGAASKRLDFDANRANYRGVARCIAAGLTVSEIDAARRRYLDHHPGAETQAHVKFVTGNAYDNKGHAALALENYEAALHVDPLNLRIQQKYWALKRRAQEHRP
ncbi:MAG: protein kinase [Archangiaceae bacterium]|nr:protein kinase [Archangiaceae bacterium]